MKLLKNLDEVLFGDARPRYQRDLDEEWRPLRDERSSLIEAVARPLSRWWYSVSPLPLIGAFLILRRLTAKAPAAREPRA